MAKSRDLFICSACSAEHTKWYGSCSSCQAWNTLQQVAPTLVSRRPRQQIPLTTLSQVEPLAHHRMIAKIGEWDRVMGGGIMSGSLIVLTGDPGVGKSTLLLQVAAAIARTHRVFYFSSEESLEQVKLRAERVGCVDTTISFSDNGQLDVVLSVAETERPDLIIIDSIQNCYQAGSDGAFGGAPGSAALLKESVFQLMRLAKERQIAILMTAHITKDGVMAGPKMIEHMVDAVFYLQGEDRLQTRVLRAVKNRFGTVNELGFFDMHADGMHEIAQIHEQVLNEMGSCAGSVLVSSYEGTRPILMEVQSLVIATKFGVAQRVVSGVEQTQVVLVAAILEKYLKIPFSSHDIFFKVSGGLRVRSSALDLGIALSLLSSYFSVPLPARSMALAELSLTGQIKPINHWSQHLGDLDKMGVGTLYAANNQKIAHAMARLVRVGHVYELASLFDNQ